MNKINKIPDSHSRGVLPDIARSHSQLNLKDQFHSRPDEKDYKKIPSIFLPLEGGPVMVFGNHNNNSGAQTDRQFKSKT